MALHSKQRSLAKSTSLWRFEMWIRQGRKHSRTGPDFVRSFRLKTSFNLLTPFCPVPSCQCMDHSNIWKPLLLHSFLLFLATFGVLHTVAEKNPVEEKTPEGRLLGRRENVFARTAQSAWDTLAKPKLQNRKTYREKCHKSEPLKRPSKLPQHDACDPHWLCPPGYLSCCDSSCSSLGMVGMIIFDCIWKALWNIQQFPGTVSSWRSANHKYPTWSMIMEWREDQETLQRWLSHPESDVESEPYFSSDKWW